ncbi:hypothetical protein LG634_22665 [Streptomyces bambusae]|uniref:hypothetical protein n=1 Tax=Streptomyces bambusae TaxID=1550616 RepID=UPI001CFD66D7|nr:hypothetical protein [Streptomyces bambusae]MCB5167620.1 hypothetical protein [Streptomyces bambusae]
MRPTMRFAVPFALSLSLLGVSPALAGAAVAAPRPAVVSAAAPVPGADALLAQVQTLGNIGGVLKPVTDLLTAVLKADDGKLPQAELDKHLAAVTSALDGLKAGLPKPPVDVPKPPVDLPKPPVDLPVPVPPLPVDAPKLPVDAPKLPVDAPKLPVDAPKLPVAAAKAAAPLDLVTAAVDNLKKSVEGLVKAAGPCGCSADAGSKATEVVTGLVNLVVALVLGAGLPLPNLPGLPELPKLPVDVPPLPVPVPVPPLPVAAPAPVA